MRADGTESDLHTELFRSAYADGTVKAPPVCSQPAHAAGGAGPLVAAVREFGTRAHDLPPNLERSESPGWIQRLSPDSRMTHASRPSTSVRRPLRLKPLPRPSRPRDRKPEDDGWILEWSAPGLH